MTGVIANLTGAGSWGAGELDGIPHLYQLEWDTRKETPLQLPVPVRAHRLQIDHITGAQHALGLPTGPGLFAPQTG